jgi:hypothetical protein
VCENRASHSANPPGVVVTLEKAESSLPGLGKASVKPRQWLNTPHVAAVADPKTLCDSKLGQDDAKVANSMKITIGENKCIGRSRAVPPSEGMGPRTQSISVKVCVAANSLARSAIEGDAEAVIQERRSCAIKAVELNETVSLCTIGQDRGTFGPGAVLTSHSQICSDFEPGADLCRSIPRLPNHWRKILSGKRAPLSIKQQVPQRWNLNNAM